MTIINKKNKFAGFSLVEAMVGLGLMSAVGLGVVKLQSNQVKNQKIIDVDYEANILSSVLYDQLKNKGTCEATFNNRVFAGPFNFSAITDGGGNVLFNAPQNYKGQNNIGISRFIAEPQSFAVSEDPNFREGSVRIAFEYQKTSGILNNQNTYKKYLTLPIRIKIDSTGKLHSCITASDDAISTSVKKFCESLNGVFDVATELCNLNTNFPGTTMADINSSSPNQAVSSSNFGLGVWEMFVDRYVDKNSNSIITGTVESERNVALNMVPTNPMDAINKEFLDSRVRCPSGQVGFMTADGVKCDNLVCNNPLEYLVGVNTNGQKICLPLVSSSENCADGGRLKVESNGSVGFECCTPNCDGAGARCSGETFPSSNSCGLCSGTAPTTVEGTWSPWQDTGENRETSECVNNQIQMEKKQTRTCGTGTALLSCQTMTCSGSDEQWIATTSQSCGLPAGKCKGYGSDTANLFIIAKTDEVQNGCRTQYRDVYFDIVTSQFKRGNIYTITQGMTFSEEAKTGDTPQTVLQRLAAKINAQNMTYPTLCNGSGSTVVTNASVVSANRLKYHINWQHQPAHGASRSCNNLDEMTCSSTPGCNWDTTSANICTGWNYIVPQGNCSGTYYKQGCAWNGMGMDFGNGSGTGSEDECMYSYPDASSCNAASSRGCYWGSVPQTCYASTQAQCSALGAGCSWKKYPDLYRSCSAASYESTCTGEGAGVCTWGPR